MVPGDVFFTIDLRHREDNVLDQMEERMRLALAAILDPLRLTYQEKQAQVLLNAILEYDRGLA